MVKSMSDSSQKVGVEVVIQNKDGKILLGKRKCPHGEGTWCLPGGHLEPGETFETAGKRETMEETGLDIEITEIMSVSTDGKYVTIGMKGKILNTTKVTEPRIMEPEKCEKWAWFDINDLPSPLFGPTERVIKSLVTGKFYVKGDGA